MPTITDRTNGVYDDFSQFKNDLVVLTNGVDDNVVINEAGATKNLGILRPDASGMTITLSGSGGLAGLITVHIVFLNANFGEIFRSLPSPAETKTAVAENLLALSGIPVSTDTQVTSREIYWTDPGGTEAKLVQTIDDNTTTTLSATAINLNTGATLDDAPAIFKKQLFPKCKYNIVYDGRLVLGNQSDNRVIPPFRDTTTFDLSAVTSTTVMTDSALTSLDINSPNVFTGMRMKMTSGAADTDVRTISVYDSSTGQITVDTAFSGLPVATDTYEIHGLLNGSTIFFSEQFGYEGYDDGTDGKGNISTIDFDVGDGTEITGLATLTREFGDSTLGELFVFKTRKIFIIVGLLSNFKRQLISDHYGCIANRSIVSILEHIYFLGDRMIYRVSRDGNVQEIGIPIYTTLVNEINWDIADTSQGVHFQDMYLLAVPFGTSAFPDRILAFNYRFNTWHIWSFGGMKITAMNRDFTDDGNEILEIAFWDENNSVSEVLELKETVQTDDGDTTEFTATGSTDTTIIDTTQSWTVNEWRGRIVTITEGPGVDEKKPIISNTSDTLTVDSNWTTNPTTDSKFAIGLIEYFFITPDMPMGQVQGGSSDGSKLYIGLRDSVSTDKLEIQEFEAFKATADNTNEYTVGTGLASPDFPEYMQATVDLNAQNMRFKVRSKRPGQTFGFRNFTLSSHARPGSE